MSDTELIGMLGQKPLPTGALMGQCLDAWMRWCKDFDERQDKCEEPKSEWEL